MNMESEMTSVAEANPFTERLAKAEDGQDVERVKPLTVKFNVRKRKRYRPIMVCLYGPPGIGKSTWATKSKEPIFIQTERGLDHLQVDRLDPIPETYEEFEERLSWVEANESYKTLVIDTLDALELLILAKVLRDHGKTSIEAFGYGKGWVLAREIWARLLTRLTTLSERINVILIGHSHLRTITDPTLTDPYDCFELKLDKKASELIYQFVDAMLFGRLDMVLAKENQHAKKGRAIINNERIMITGTTTGIVAKNRWDLPFEMEFSYEALRQGIMKYYQTDKEA